MHERNMLFGLLAVRHKKIPVDDIATLAEQTVGAQTDLGSLLVAAGTISEEDRKALEDSVAQTIEQHGSVQDALKTLDADEDSLRTLSRSLLGTISSSQETIKAGDPNLRSQMETIQTGPTVERSQMETIQSLEDSNGDRSSMATIASVATADRSAMETISSEGDTRAAATAPMFGKSPADSVTLVGLHGKPGTRPRSDMAVPAVCEHEGRYKTIKTFGAGGMGQIYLVHDTHLGRDIALKTLLPDRVPGGSNKTRTRTGAPTMEVLTVPIIARFLQEAHVTGQLQHPGIIPIYELGYKPDGTLYYTMQFLRGLSIQDKLNEAKTIQDRLPLLTNFLDACQAIGYAHSRGVIHRDIKPMNIMTGAFGETVVIDWGIAKVKGEMDIHEKDIKETVKVMQIGDTAATARTMYGQTIGSPFYMPPEQAAGKTDQVDERADIYSLGALLYIILTGVPPYHGKNVRQFLTDVQEFDPKPVTELEPSAPKELAAVVKKAMARKREDRYQSAMDLADEVQRYLSGGLVSAYQYRMSELLARFYKRNKRMLNLAAIFSAIIVIGAFIAAVMITYQRAEARRELYFANINIAQDALSEKTPEAARQRLAVAPMEHNNWEWGYLAAQANADLMTIPSDGQNVAYGDGFIVVADDKGATEVWSAETGEKTHTLLESAGAGYGFDFAKAAGRVAVMGNDGARVWEANTGTELYRLEDKPYEGAEQLNRQVSLSRDGRMMAALTTDGQARVVNLETKQEVFATPMDLTAALLKLSDDGTRLVTVNMAMDIAVFETATGTMIGTAMSADQFNVKTIAIAPDNSRIAIGTDHSLQVFNAADMGLAFMYPADVDNPGPVTIHFNLPRTIAFSPDGAHVAGGTKDGRVGLWDAATGAPVTIDAFAHGDQVRSLQFSPDGRYIATASDDNGAKIWEMPSTLNRGLRSAHEFIGHDGPVWALDFAPDGARVATTAFNDTTKLWDLRAEAELHRPTALAFDAARDWTAGALGAEIGVWDARTQYRVATLTGHQHAVRAVAFAPDSPHLVSLSMAPASKEDPTQPLAEARIWSLPAGELVSTVRLARNTTQVALAQNASILVVRQGSDVRVVKVGDGSVAMEGKTSGGFVVDTAGGKIAYVLEQEGAPGNHDVHVVNLAALTADSPRTIQSRTQSVPFLNFDPQGKWLAASTWSENEEVDLVLLPLDGGDAITLRTAHSNKVNAVAFNAEGTRVATGSADFTINVFDVEEGAEPLVLAGHSGAVTGLSFAPEYKGKLNTGSVLGRPNHTRLASASLDKTFRLWNVERGTTIITVQDEAQRAKGDVITPSRVAFNAQGDLLATITTPAAVPPFVSRAFPWNIGEYEAPQIDTENIPEEEQPMLTFKGMMENYKRGLWQQQ